MNYRKFFMKTALVTLVSLVPAYSFSAPASVSTSIEGEDSGFFVGLKWMPGVSHFGAISIPKKDSKEYQVWGNSKSSTNAISNTNFATELQKGEYKPEYANDYKGFGLQAGYSLSGNGMSGFRVQIDGAYQTFYVAGYEKTGKDGNKAFYAVSEKAADDLANGYLMKHKGYKIINANIDVCYDMVPEGMPVVPFACAGVGIDKVALDDAKDKEDKELSKIVPAFQVKAGAAYQLTSQLHAFVNAYYRGHFGETEFENVKSENPKLDNLNYNQYLGYYGAEAGIKVLF